MSQLQAGIIHGGNWQLSPKLWNGCQWGQDLVIGIACFTTWIPLTRDQDTHTHTHSPFLLLPRPPIFFLWDPVTNISPDIFQTYPMVGIVRLLLHWWGGSDVHSILQSNPSAQVDWDWGCGCTKLQWYWSFTRHHPPTGIIRNSNLPLPEPATNLVLLGHRALQGGQGWCVMEIRVNNDELSW